MTQVTNTFDRDIAPDFSSAFVALEKVGAAARAVETSSSAFKKMRARKLVKCMEEFSALENSGTPQAFAFCLAVQVMMGMHYNLKDGLANMVKKVNADYVSAFQNLDVKHIHNVDDIVYGTSYLLRIVPQQVLMDANKHWRENGGLAD